MKFTSQQIAAALGSKIPAANIDANWPLIWAALDSRFAGAVSAAAEIAAIATVAVETGCFRPIRERGGPAYFQKLYWEDQERARVLGNLSAEDAIAFRGRGFVQITGRGNYHRYGILVGRDLVANPDDALIPAVAADVLALYFHERGIPQLADQAQWERVRRRVNGGLNGWADFIGYVHALEDLGLPAATTTPPPPTA